MVVPRPGALSTHSAARLPCRIVETISNPRPVPALPLVVKFGRNIRARTSSVMPVPVSLTVNSAIGTPGGRRNPGIGRAGWRGATGRQGGQRHHRRPLGGAGVTGIDGEVDDHLRHLRRVGPDRQRGIVHVQPHRMPGDPPPAQQIDTVLQQLAKVMRAARQVGAHQPPQTCDQVARNPDRAADALQPLVQPNLLARLQFQYLDRPGDHGDQVVEVMRHAAGDLRHGVPLLGALQVLAQGRLFFLRAHPRGHFGGDVEADARQRHGPAFGVALADAGVHLQAHPRAVR